MAGCEILNSQWYWSLKIKILESAVLDLTEGARFYENFEPGLGAYFLDSLFSDIDSLQMYAGIHVRKFPGFYCMLAKRFPFAVYYTISSTTAIVHAVLDCRRNPAWIREQVDSRKNAELD
jgi:hypothetical protein